MFRRLRLVCGAAALAFLLPAIAQADTFMVTTNSDTTDASDGVVTLREAITLANDAPGPDTIGFAEELSGEVLVLTQGELVISDDLHIDASNLAQAPVIDADQKSRVMHFTAPEGDLGLTRLTLRNGRTSVYNVFGGGILFASTGALTLTNSTVSGNYAPEGLDDDDDRQGGVGGGISTSRGSVTLISSIVSGNTAGGYGAKGGGIHTSVGSVTLIDSTLSGNFCSGGYARGGGIDNLFGAITLTNSTLSGNRASDYGGGIYTRSGAITLSNSTLSGNAAGEHGGGIYSRSGITTLTDSTVSGNFSESSGGGIAANLGSLSLTNSIIAGNSSEGRLALDVRSPNDPASNLEVSHCLIGNSTGLRLDEAKVNVSNLTDVDPLLAPLASNGGPTQTHALLAGSPAIDQGNATGTDQRGAARVDKPEIPNAEGGNGSDIGAYERNIPLIVSDPSDVTDGDFSAGNLSLREAISLANDAPGPDTIGFAEALSGGVILLTQGELAISDDLSIDASNLTRAPIIDADRRSRVMHFTAAEGDLELARLTLRKGRVTSPSARGGGIRFSSNGALTLTDSTLSGNSASGQFGAGGGIHTTLGAIRLTNSTVSGNSARSDGGDADGGGIHSTSGDITLINSTVSGNTARTAQGIVESGAYGGGIFTISGVITLTNSTVSGNTASAQGDEEVHAFGGGIFTSSGAISLTNSTLGGNSASGEDSGFGGGIQSTSGAITLTNSTLSGNSTSGDNVDGYGGGIRTISGAITLANSTLSGNSAFGRFGAGGGIYTTSGAITLTNSTLSGNSVSSRSGDGWGGGIRTNSGALTLTNSTLSGNSAFGLFGRGGGITTFSGALTLTNSIVAGNSSNGTAPDVRPPNDPANNLEVSHCLIGESTGARLDEAKVNLNNLTDVDPLLAPLADNGGDTQTMLPFPGSPVIDAAGPGAPTKDQRGFDRSGTPDIGAVEYQGRSDLSRVFEIDNDGDGNSFGVEQALGTDPFVADPANPRNLIAPSFNPDGQPMLGFGIAEDAAPGTLWILERSTDLLAFDEIYRFDGTTHIVDDEFPTEIESTDTGVIVTDQAPPSGGALYRFRTILTDPDVK